MYRVRLCKDRNYLFDKRMFIAYLCHIKQNKQNIKSQKQKHYEYFKLFAFGREMSSGRRYGITSFIGRLPDSLHQPPWFSLGYQRTWILRSSQ